jgi:hypothetical protein
VYYATAVGSAADSRLALKVFSGGGDGGSGGDDGGGGGGGGVRVDFLVQCIEAGVDLFADVQRQLVVKALQPPPQQRRARPAQAAARL